MKKKNISACYTVPGDAEYVGVCVSLALTSKFIVHNLRDISNASKDAFVSCAFITAFCIGHVT